MADIFVSSSRLDQDRVKPIVDRLGSLGYSVWLDRPVRKGHVSVDEISNQLDSARAVLTVWSANARNALWVHAESAYAFDANKLTVLRLDDAPLPTHLRALPAAEMRAGRSEWGPLEDKLAKIIRDGASPDTATDAPKASTIPSARSAPRFVALLLGAALIVFAAAMSAAGIGAITPDIFQALLIGVLAIGSACVAFTAYRIFNLRRAGR